MITSLIQLPGAPQRTLFFKIEAYPPVNWIPYNLPDPLVFFRIPDLAIY